MGLAELRKSKKLTQRALAERAHVPYVSIANIERGARDASDMTLGTAVRLADALKVRDLRKLLD
ncbi:helix-turn-helix transcriptional regulator [Bifidobacterium choerinum]|uniref:The helix-turn-helix motif n=1 Tax=Bifidobacterium choerinum TaxID=35760 RepID=A0A087AF78_9BIFI|nr:the helix-turn-helix motif [Bifidobacterium choerinum]